MFTEAGNLAYEKGLGDVLRLIDDKMQADFSNRSSLEQNWFNNIINVMGYQWTKSRNSSKRPKIRYRGNMLLSLVSHTSADIVRNDPDWNIEADAEDSDSMSKASIAERYLEHVLDNAAYKKKIRKFAVAARSYGTCLFTPYWDPTAGDAISPTEWFGDTPDEKDLQELLDAFDGSRKDVAKFLAGKMDLRSGAIRLEVVTPFEFYYDTSAEEIEDAHWVMQAKIRSIHWVKKLYGKKAKGLMEDSITNHNGPGYLQRLRALTSPNSPAGGGEPVSIRDSVIVYDYWERPSEEFPNGRHVVVAGQMVMVDEENPYHGTKWQLPFTMARDNVIPSQFWGFASINDALGPQKAYNKMVSMQLGMAHSTLNAKWMVPKGALSSAGALNHESNEVVFYNSMGSNGAHSVPHRVAPPPMPGWVFEMTKARAEEVQQMMGAHEVSTGGTTPGQSPGITIELLQAADKTRLGAFYQEVEECLKDLARMILDISRIQISDDLSVRTFTSVVGKDRESEVIKYAASDLSYRSVAVELGVSSERKRMAKKQKTLEALQYKGIDPLNNEQDKNLLYDAIDADKPSFRPAAVHEARAKHEHTMLDQGLPQMTMNFYDDGVHLSHHYDRMTKLSFDKLPDEVKEVWLQHVEEHKHNKLNKMLEKAGEQAALMGMAPPQQGAGGQQGGPQKPQGGGNGGQGQQLDAQAIQQEVTGEPPVR